jgi:hypothetical protein
MGASPSSLSRPSRITSGEELILKTKETREMSNALFEFMFKQWDNDGKEIWDITRNPEEYVIALSDLIEKQFSVLGYITKTNQVGEIYFVKLSDLTRKKDSYKESSNSGLVAKLREGHKQHARIIAFYFIRLFQIMGALLMVVKDIKYVINLTPDGSQTRNLGSPKIEDQGRSAYTQQQLPRFYYDKVQGGGGSYPTSRALGYFEFLRYYLRGEASSEMVAKNSQLQGAYRMTNSLFFKTTAVTNSNSTSPIAKFYILISKDGRSAPIAVEKEFTVDTTSASDPFIFKSPDSLDDRDKIKLYPRGLKIKMKVNSSGQRSTTGTITFFRDSITDNEEYEKGVKYTITASEPISPTDLQARANELAEFLQQFLLAVVRRDNPNYRDYKLYKPDDSEYQSSGKTVKGSEQYKTINNKAVNEILKYFVDKDSKGVVKQPHCVARALQLLDPEALQKAVPDVGKTGICKIQIGDSKEALPQYTPMKSLSKLYGKINPADYEASKKVLDAFFGEDVQALSSEQLKNNKKESEELQMGIAKLSAAFGIKDTKGVDSFQKMNPPSPAGCPPGSTDSIEIRNQQVLLNLQDVAHQLLASHYNSTVQISKFLMVIFNIEKEGDKWKVKGPRSSILNAGFPVLDQLTDTARELLVDYYSECESLYQRGVASWSASNQNESVKAPVAPPASAPPANNENPRAPVRLPNARSNEPTGPIR